MSGGPTKRRRKTAEEPKATTKSNRQLQREKCLARLSETLQDGPYKLAWNIKKRGADEEDSRMNTYEMESR